MQVQPNKFDRGKRKRVEKSKSMNNSGCISILGKKVDGHPVFRHAVPQLDFRIEREKEAVDVVFQALLSDANQELARLLQDVRTGPQAGLLGGTQNRPISELLMRAVRCAAKQYMLQAELGALALKDELTGFYNRRAFQALGERQLKLGVRYSHGMLLFFIDVDGLKQINDSLGHIEGDLALKRTAETLKKTFRDSDVIARLGGDEFAVLAVEASGYNEATIMARLDNYLSKINTAQAEYEISLSVGVARFDHRSPTSITDLMAQADRAMYERKRNRSRAPIAVGAA